MVGRALDRIPEEFTSVIENCVLVIEDEAPSGKRHLGLYEGVPTTQREGAPWGMPDVITIYQGPLTRMCSDLKQLEHEVYVTVVHEIGHYFGLDDDRLRALSWG